MRFSPSAELVAVAIALATVFGCGSSATTSTAPSPLVRCALTLTVGDQTIPAQGGSGTIGVSATRECTWTASVDGSWLSLKSSANGQGEGTVEFSAAANPDPVMRRGALVLNAQRAELTQSAAQCDITLAETSASFGPGGGSGRVDVRASSQLCIWGAASDSPWIAIRAGTEGKGSASVHFDVTPTDGPPRTGRLTVAGQVYSVTQSEGCSYATSTAAVTLPASGGQDRIVVTTGPGCPWTAASNVSWLLFGQETGSGPGIVNFTVLPTDGPTRTGTAVVAGKPFTVTQGQGCTYQVQPATHTVGSSGGTATVNVSAASGCAWTASSDVPWISIQSASPGSGNGLVTFAAAPSTGPARTGTLTIAGQKVTVNQSQGCAYSISPTQESVPATGGGGQVTVTADAGCAWTASSAVPWITITAGSSGTGGGVVTYAAAATSGPARSGTMQVAGQTFTVNQGQGCTFALSSSAATVPERGGETAFDVQATAGCAWTASSQAPWISITAGATGNGNGTVRLNVAANTGPPRSGTVTAAGRTFTVNQGVGCVITLTPTSENVPATGGNGTVAVAVEAGCAWTATSGAAWLSIAGPNSGSGNGSVAYSAAANAGAARSGSLDISGQTFTVHQAAGCTFTLSSETVPIAAAGGGARIDISTAADCAWTATSNTSWIAIPPGAAGTGPGAVDLAVAPNGGPARSGTATIAGRTVTVNQESGCTFAINPTSAPIPAAGGTGSVGVTAAAGCEWTAVSQAPWILVTAGANGSGDGTVQFTVEANATGAARTGTIAIAGHTFTVNQQ